MNVPVVCCPWPNAGLELHSENKEDVKNKKEEKEEIYPDSLIERESGVTSPFGEHLFLVVVGCVERNSGNKNPV